jgi:hypothetical protein
MTVLFDYNQEIPEVEGFVDWLYEHSEFAEGPSAREMREALHKAYLKGQQNAAQQEPLGKSPVATGNGATRQDDPRGSAVRDVPAVAAPSPTPRTDALVGDFDFPWSYQMEMLVRHAEKLEHELNAAPEKLWWERK